MASVWRLAIVHAWLYKWLLAALWAVLFAGVFLRWWRPSGNWLLLLFFCGFSVALVAGWARWQRQRLIREHPLPQFLKRKVRQAYPHLSGKDAELVERGLRQFFLACSRGGGYVAMPSRVVDAMWHEFILHTQAYRDWCALTLGRFLHHTPAEALSARAKQNDGLRRAWYWSCKEEAIHPRAPTRLPLLFALDAKLAIPDGFRYVPDCGDIDAKSRQGGEAGFVYCATSFGDGSAAGDGDGFGGAQSQDGSSDGGGDGDGGGSGCGGGGD
jgi:hypothetical protein